MFKTRRCLSILFSLVGITVLAQVSYNANRIYSLRKVVPTYTGSAIQISRPCDNATANIGFTSCGDLDTMAIYNHCWISYPLTNLFTPAASYSLRKLTCSYSGNAIRVRSSAVGSPTADIGFTAFGDLDTATLKTFVGSNSAFVTVWYDQSGNGRNASQATATIQPRIVNAGVIERQNGRPAIYFYAASNQLKTPSFTAYNTAAYFNFVAKASSTLIPNEVFSKTGTTASNVPAPFDFYNNVVITGNGGAFKFFGLNQIFDAAQPLGIWSVTQSSAMTTCSLNGVDNLSGGTSAAYGDNGEAICIGQRRDGLGGLIGWVQEIVTYGGGLPASNEIKLLEYSQKLYYSTSGPAYSRITKSVTNPKVLIWYDQSGNGLHATSTSTNTAKIMNTNRFFYANGRPSLFFDGLSNNSFTAATNAGVFSNGAGSSSYLSVVGKYDPGLGTSFNNKPFVYQGNQFSGGFCWSIDGSQDVSSTSTWFANFCAAPNNLVSTTAASVMTIADAIQIGGAFTNFYVNGTLANLATASTNTNNGIFRIGQYDNLATYLNGYVSEVHLFDANFLHGRRLLVEANQAAYYGLSIASAIYTPPTSTTYNKFVNGIGRTTSTSDTLLGTRFTAGLGMRTGTTATDYIKDVGDYLTAGVNCINSGTSTAGCPTNVNYRWSDDWYINKTDVNANGGTVQIFFDQSDYGAPSGIYNSGWNYFLLYRSPSSSNFTIVPSTTVSTVGDQITFSLDANSIITNYYYTLGIGIPLAGGVASNLNLWLKANAGTNTTTDGAAVSTWADQSGLKMDGTSTGSPLFRAGSNTLTANYNPAITFDGSSQGFSLPTGFSDFTAGTTAFFVINTNFGTGPNNYSRLFHSSTGTFNQNLFTFCRNASTFRTALYCWDATGTGTMAYSSPIPVLSPSSGFGIAAMSVSSGTPQQSVVANGYYNSSADVPGNCPVPTNVSRSVNYIGRSFIGEYQNGIIPEVIIYNRILSATERQKINSYLGLKYSITQSRTGLGSYLNSSGATVFTDGGTYWNNIIGLARDDMSGFYQKQSKTSDDSVRVYRGSLASANATNLAGITNTLSYLVVGSNTGRLSQGLNNNEKPLACGLISRMEREWKITNTNFSDNFTFEIKLNNTAQPSSVTPAHLNLLVDDDGDFSTGVTNCYKNGDGSGINFTYSSPVITISGISTTLIPLNSTRYITIASTSSATPLPVELISFTPVKEDWQVRLNWTTASEKNANYFKVQRLAADGENFVDVTIPVKATGRSDAPTNYTILDEAPQPGINYYRLKQVDSDQTIRYSEIKMVDFGAEQSTGIYPNPGKGLYTVMNCQNYNHLYVRNVLGQVIYSQAITGNRANLDLTALPNGLYYVELRKLNDEDTRIVKLIKY